MKLMVPLDGSSLAEGALPRAVALASRWQARLVLARVCDPSGSVAPELPKHLQEKMLDLSRTAAHDYLVKVRERFPEVSIDCVLGVGRPRQEIARLADQTDCDLIVMNSHARKGAERWLLGSVAEGVLRRSSRPVLLLRGQADEPVPFTRILVPVDGSPLSLGVLEHLQPFLEGDTEVQLYQSSGFLPQELALEEESESLQHCLDQMATHLREIKLAGCRLEVAVEHGEPAEAIVRWAETHPCQLIAMSTLGRSGDPSLWLGSVTEKVSRNAPCAVLACPVRARPAQPGGESEPATADVAHQV
ncbi:MAG: universal stress protein [Vulcanimicrobiota bacterium]